MEKLLPAWDLTSICFNDESALDEQKWHDLHAKMDTMLKTISAVSNDTSYGHLANILDQYDAIVRPVFQVNAYAYMRFTSDMAEKGVGAFLKNVQEKSALLEAKGTYVYTHIASLDMAYLEGALKAIELEPYHNWIKGIIQRKPHTLESKVEAQWVERSVVAFNAWQQLEQAILGKTRVVVDDKRISLSDASNLLRESCEEIREKSLTGILQALDGRYDIICAAYNAVMKDCSISNKWRSHTSVDESMHITNHVNAEWVNALSNAVVESFPSTSHALFNVRARALGKDVLEGHNIMAPMETSQDIIPFDEALQIIKEAYAELHPSCAQYMQRMIDENRMDLALRASKEGGAYCYTVPGKGPFVLTNYYGKFRDFLCLAHELGHALHGFLAHEVPSITSHPSLILAEVASLFSEKVCVDYLVRTASKEKKRLYLSSYVSDQIMCIQGSISYHLFEKEMHEKRAASEVADDYFEKRWKDIRQGFFGDVVRLPERYGLVWSSIPHFFHTPFYVYSYAFSGLIVHNLYEQKDTPGFMDKYLKFLSYGGSINFEGVRNLFNLDHQPHVFFKKALIAQEKDVNLMKKYVESVS